MPNFYWDYWKNQALVAGVSQELATLGREVMRDHYQHGKEDHLLGCAADGEKMLQLCLADPAKAEDFFSECLHPEV